MTSIYFEDTESTGDLSANKFWCHPSESRSSSYDDDSNVFIAFESEVDSVSQKRGYEGSLLLGQQSNSASKRRQTKMLLVALIETFCRLYGDSPPDANHKIFFLICQTLRSLGLIDSEFVDEMASVRSTFQSAFQRLFYTAVQTVRDQNLFLSQKKLITSTPGGLEELPPPSSSVVSSGSTTSSSHMSSEKLLFNLSVQNSRYMNDFIEIHMLGKGGFASVWRARNKLDGIDYAVKKVRLGRDLDTGKQMPYEKIFREIKHLARLEHHNVVRYYSSWLEYSTAAQRHGDSDNIIDESTDLPSVTDKQQEDDESLETSSAFRSQDGEWVLYIQMQLCPATLYDYIKYRNQQCQKGHNAVDPKRNIEIFTQILEGAAYIHQQGLIHRDLKPTNIFLSMPTSEHQRRSSHASIVRRRGRSSSLSASSSSSLKCKRDHDMSLDSITNANGICDCMWEESWIPKIGDFGLAAALAVDNDPNNMLLSTTPLPTLPAPSTTSSDESAVSFLTNPRSSPPSSRKSDRPSFQRTRTSGVGTRTYASPEQMARTPNAYDEKADIYSLGIIFFELYKPFSTGMERAEEIEALKQGVFPDGFVEQYPKESALILWMMDNNPEHRPSAAELLDFELFAETKEDIFASLQSELQAKSLALDNKTLEVATLRQRMEQLEREKQQELEAMQRRLQEMQRQLEQAHISQPSSSDEKS